MGRGNQRNIFRAHIFQLLKNIRQALRRDRFTALCARNFVILTERTAQITARKKDRTAAVFKRDTRFFKGVQVIFCDMQPRNAACAYAARTIRATFHRTKGAIFQLFRPFAVHRNYYSMNKKIMQAALYMRLYILRKS